jgi:hypothetical protein
MEAELGKVERREHDGEDADAKLASGPRVAAGALRCPFCRAAVDLATQEWVACESCLARHHATCWREHGSCSSCGSTRRLAPGRGRDLSRLALGVAGLAFAVALGGAGLALSAGRSPGPPPIDVKYDVLRGQLDEN